MKVIIIALIFLACGAVAQHTRTEKTIEGSPATWRTVRDSFYRSGIQTPCPGASIPEAKSRKATAIDLVCGSGRFQETRVKEVYPPEIENLWFELEQVGDREGMQKVKQDASDVSWKARVPFNTAVSWRWTEKKYGQNSSQCGYEKVLAQCTKPRYRRESYIDRDCRYVPDSSPSGGNDSGGWNSGGSHDDNDSGGSYENESDPFGVIDPKMKPEAPFQQQEAPLVAKVLNAFNPIGSAHAETVCEDVTRYRDVYDGQDNYSCYDSVARTCEWEETHSETMSCKPSHLNLKVEFIKKDPSVWGPGKDEKYMDILPNGYDLLPGEKEFLTVVTNSQGLTNVMTPAAAVDDKWNEYEFLFDKSHMECSLDTIHELKLSVHTQGRIKRKTPNALVLPVDENGVPKDHILFNEFSFNGKLVPGKPYEIRLTDSSDETIAAAARQSRSFADLETAQPVEGISSKHGKKNEDVSLSRFWKDTQFRVRLIELSGSKWRKDTLFTDAIYTNSSYISQGYNRIKIPLHGEAGLSGLYHPSGKPAVFEFLFGESGQFGEIELTPGKKYQMRVAMLQRGIWFYESGCSDDQANCENEKANDQAFSSDLVIDFEADESVDTRDGWQKFNDFIRERNIWKKLDYIF